jgi:ribosomal protein S18 acetylase RimI-like enzyme
MLERIHQIEEFAANALPPLHVQDLDGWRLRYSEGVTRRANSVLANGHEARLSLEEKLERVEAFYARFGVRARYQLCPTSQPQELHEVLDARGYRHDGRVNVQVAELTTVLRHQGVGSMIEVTLHETLRDVWFDLYRQVEGADEQMASVRRVMLTRIAPPAAFALATLDGEPAAVGLGVLEQGQAGIFNMATHPSFRRRGAARAVLHALARWAEQQGGQGMYLQVAEGNDTARAVYERQGFRTLYTYHYREAP